MKLFEKKFETQTSFLYPGIRSDLFSTKGDFVLCISGLSEFFSLPKTNEGTKLWLSVHDRKKGDSLKIRLQSGGLLEFEVFNGEEWIEVGFWGQVDSKLNRLFKSSKKKVLHIVVEEA